MDSDPSLPDEKYWDEKQAELGLSRETKPFEPPVDKKPSEKETKRFHGVELNVWYTWFAWYPVRMDATGRLVWLRNVSLQYYATWYRSGYDNVKRIILYTRRRPFHPRVGNRIWLDLGIRCTFIYFILPVAAGLALIWGLLWGAGVGLRSLENNPKPAQTTPWGRCDDQGGYWHMPDPKIKDDKGRCLFPRPKGLFD